MLSLFHKYSTIISVLLFLSLLIFIWLFPSSGLISTILFLTCGFVLASFPVVEKHRQDYFQGKISRGVCVRNILFDVTGILLALLLAGVLGRYIAELAARQISHEFTKLIVGVIVGLLIGIAIGIFVQQSLRRFIKVSPKN
jgi:hypothetical protein